MRFVEGLTDEQVIALFQTARRLEYEKIIQGANLLLTDWSSGKIDPKDPAVRGSAQVSKLQRRFNDVAAIDFFYASERGTAEILIKDLTARLSGEGLDSSAIKDELDELRGRVWVTRKKPLCGPLRLRLADSALCGQGSCFLSSFRPIRIHPKQVKCGSICSTVNTLTREIDAHLR